MPCRGAGSTTRVVATSRRFSDRAGPASLHLVDGGVGGRDTGHAPGPALPFLKSTKRRGSNYNTTESANVSSTNIFLYPNVSRTSIWLTGLGVVRVWCCGEGGIGDREGWGSEKEMRYFRVRDCRIVKEHGMHACTLRGVVDFLSGRWMASPFWSSFIFLHTCCATRTPTAC